MGAFIWKKLSLFPFINIKYGDSIFFSFDKICYRVSLKDHVSYVYIFMIL